MRRLSLLCSVRSMRWPDPLQPDPITDEQVRVLFALLGGSVSDEELEGFLIVCSRLVDEFGGHRTHELADIFRTSTPEGRDVLRQSLRYMNRWVGGLAGYESRFPVTIIPARPAFPLFKIVGIDRIAQTLFRVLDSHDYSPQYRRAGQAIHRPNGTPARCTKTSAPCAAVKAMVSLVFLHCVGKPFSHAGGASDSTRMERLLAPGVDSCIARFPLHVSHLQRR